MGLYENIQSLCKRDDLPISHLEKELSLGNGSIRRWNESPPSTEKLRKVANFFGVSMDFLQYGFDPKLLVQLINYVRHDRTIEQFAQDMDVDVDEISRICLGLISKPPSLEILEKIIANNPISYIVDKDEILSAAGYDTSESISGLQISHQALNKDLTELVKELTIKDVYPPRFSKEVFDRIIAGIEPLRQKFWDLPLNDCDITPVELLQFRDETVSLGFKKELVALLNKVKRQLTAPIIDFFPGTGELPKHHIKDYLQTIASLSVPILGKIRCGVPLLDEANWEDRVQVPNGIHADFAAKAEGDSMIYAGIQPNDIILFREGNTPQNGQVVATRYCNETEGVNLKYYVKANGQALLRSANPKYEDIALNEDHEIIGVMTGLIRDGAPSMHDYKSLLAVKSDADDRWTETIALATAHGLQPEDIQNMINLQITMAFNLAKKKR
jgi:SOS-response transcriptional repressor LexA/transcriptional regulator with XRE-family HTH domain